MQFSIKTYKLKLAKINILIVTIFAILALYYVTTIPLYSIDTFYHLNIGRQVFQERQIPSVDKFVYSIDNPKFISTEWLSGLIFYFFYILLGNFGLMLVKISCALGTLLFLFLSLKIVTSNPKMINLSILIVGYLLAFRLHTRPEMFSLVFLSFINYLFLKLYLKKEFSLFIYILPILFLIWPNIHPFVPLGYLIFCFFLFLFLTEKLINKRSSKLLGNLLAIFTISTFVLSVQAKQVLFFKTATNFSKLITEWLSLWNRIFPSKEFAFIGNPNPDVYIYILIIPIYLSSLILFLRKNKNLKSLLFAVFPTIIFLSPLKYYRLIAPAILLTTPYFLIFIRQILSIHKYDRIINVINSTIILILLFSSFTNHRLGTNEGSEEYFPEKTAQFIKENLTTKNIFAPGTWNDYFIWKIPEIRTFADVMHSYRTNDNINDEKTLHNLKLDSKNLIEKYNIDTTVGTMNYSFGSQTPVFKLDNWHLVYVDNSSTVYARDDIIKDKSIIIKYIKPYLSQQLKFTDDEKEKAVDELNVLSKKQPDNIFPRSQLIIYYLKTYIDTKNKDYLDKAISMSFDGKKHFNDIDNGAFSYYLATAYLLKNDCQKYKAFAQEAVDNNPTNQTFKEFLNSSKNCDDHNIKLLIK